MTRDLQLNNNHAGNFNCSMAEFFVMADANGIHSVRLDAHHLSKGRIRIEGMIEYRMADSFASSMHYLADEKKPVDIFINSPGGEVYSGLLIYDVIQSYKYPVNIWCTGTAASMAAIILAGGKKGHRFILPHSRVMIHEPLIAGGMGGSATTIEKAAQSILETRELTNGILAKHTGKTLEEINDATIFDNFMDAKAAVEFGICDEIRNFF